MRVLWLTMDQTKRVMQFWQVLRDQCLLEMDRAGWDYTVKIRDVPNPYGAWVQGVERDPDAALPLVTEKEMGEYDFIFVDRAGGSLYEPWAARRGPWAVLIDDTHRDYQVRRYNTMHAQGAGLWVNHQHPFRERFPGVPYKWFPFAADPDVYHPYREWRERTPGVVMSGVIGDLFYPVRTATCKALQGEPWAYTIKRPKEVSDASTGPRGAAYARRLSRFTIAATCSSRSIHTLCKTFEIPACGTALLCDATPEMADLGFIEDRHYIQLDPFAPGFVDATRNLVESPDELEDVANEGRELILARHTIKRRARLWMEYVEDAVRASR